MLCWTVSKTIDGVYWTVFKAKRRGHYASVAVRNKLYYFGALEAWTLEGGSNNNMYQIDVHVFNTVSLCWLKLPPVTPGRGGPCHPEIPSTRWGHITVLVEDTVYIWGGFPHCNVLYGFDVDTHRWFKPRVSGTVPEGRGNRAASVLGKVVYVLGGYTHMSNNLYKLDTSTMVWSLIYTRGTPPPCSLLNHAMIIGTKLFVFGALWFVTTRSNYIRVFDTETNCWLSTPTPSTQLLPERLLHFPKCFAYNGELYIFDRRDRSQASIDMWKFSPETFYWKKVDPKGEGPQSEMHMLCCCVVGDRIFIFGGNKDREPADLYILDLSPSLKTLCKLSVIQSGLEQSGLPHNIRWELAAMTTNNNNKIN